MSEDEKEDYAIQKDDILLIAAKIVIFCYFKKKNQEFFFPIGGRIQQSGNLCL